MSAPNLQSIAIIILIVEGLALVPISAAGSDGIDLDLPEDVKLGDCWAKKFLAFWDRLAHEANELSGPLMQRYSRCKPVLKQALKESVDRMTASEIDLALSWADQLDDDNYESDSEDDHEDEPIVRLVANKVVELANKLIKSYRDERQFKDLFERVMESILAPFSGILFDQVDLYELLIQSSIHDPDFETRFEAIIHPDPMTREWIPIAKLFKNINDLDQETLAERVFEYLTQRNKAIDKVRRSRVPFYKVKKYLSRALTP